MVPLRPSVVDDTARFVGAEALAFLYPAQGGCR